MCKKAFPSLVTLAMLLVAGCNHQAPIVRAFGQNIELARECELDNAHHLPAETPRYFCETNLSAPWASIKLFKASDCIGHKFNTETPGSEAEIIADYSSNGIQHVLWRIISEAPRKRVFFVQISTNAQDCLVGTSSDLKYLKGISSLWRNT